MTAEHRPLVAVVFGDDSVAATSLREAATNVCDLLWIIDSSQMTQTWIVRLVPKLGQTIDIAGMSEDEAAAAVRSFRPDGIVAYADAQIALAAALAERLGLDYFDHVVAERLLDKVVQRQALHDGGLPTPRCLAVPASPTAEDVASLAARLTFPVVLKPRHGAASRETHLVNDAAHLETLLLEVSSYESDLDMVVEEFMGVASQRPSPHLADYVSVESVVAAGRISHVAVSGRPPAVEPFRETGLIVPTDFAPELVDLILEVATGAIEAIGIQIGCLHTEIKVTDKGVRAIEVNGRLGGFVPQTVALALPGVNLLEISLRVALGERIVFEQPVPTDHVGYALVGQPPVGARRVASVDGLDRLGLYAGVDSVSLSRRPGDEVDWRKGSQEYVFSVLGIASDHQAVQAVEQFIADEVVVTYE
jgi:hypothetical protein